MDTRSAPQLAPWTAGFAGSPGDHRLPDNRLAPWTAKLLTGQAGRHVLTKAKARPKFLAPRARPEYHLLARVSPTPTLRGAIQGSFVHHPRLIALCWRASGRSSTG